MNTEETKYQKAKERVEALRGFYIHLTVYVSSKPVSVSTQYYYITR